MRYLLIQLAILPVRLYRIVISPFFPQSCRHTPTCSEYMIGAMKEWGVIRGGWMGLKRLSTCHPWGSHGYDPVPLKNSKETKSPE
ncbi:MAG: membrane protein insertion efficiency factor YidD [Flavobacteriales bacterium]|nr:membrane protein insertion efficiency factor YidD [Flavobacteriales bacterium]